VDRELSGGLVREISGEAREAGEAGEAEAGVPLTDGRTLVFFESMHKYFWLIRGGTPKNLCLEKA
jgi:hypothetical protein